MYTDRSKSETVKGCVLIHCRSCCFGYGSVTYWQVQNTFFIVPVALNAHDTLDTRMLKLHCHVEIDGNNMAYELAKESLSTDVRQNWNSPTPRLLKNTRPDSLSAQVGGRLALKWPFIANSAVKAILTICITATTTNFLVKNSKRTFIHQSDDGNKKWMCNTCMYDQK